MRLTLLVLTLAFAAVYGVAKSPATPSSNFEEICQELKFDCSEVRLPIVVITQLVPPMYNGLYIRGEPYIFVNADNSLQQIVWTTYHETVHYVIENMRPGTEVCVSEEVARKLTAWRFWLEYTEDWREVYGC